MSIIQNDNDTNTILYTSEMFQPMADTFSDKYVFEGSSVRGLAMKGAAPREAGQSRAEEVKRCPLVYVSLGTVLNNNVRFYQSCIDALRYEQCKSISRKCGKNRHGFSELRWCRKSCRIYRKYWKTCKCNHWLTYRKCRLVVLQLADLVL